MMYISGFLFLFGAYMLRWGYKIDYQDFKILGGLLLLAAVVVGAFSVMAFSVLGHYRV